MRTKYDTVEEAFWANVVKRTDQLCWNWSGAVTGSGYGQLTHKGIHYRSHRLSHELLIGPITERNVCHRCDNRQCVNPAHLYQGSQSQNMKDAVKRGRIGRMIVERMELGRVNALAKVVKRAARQARIIALGPNRRDDHGRFIDGCSSADLLERDEFGRLTKAGAAPLPPRQRDARGCFIRSASNSVCT